MATFIRPIFFPSVSFDTFSSTPLAAASSPSQFVAYLPISSPAFSHSLSIRNRRPAGPFQCSLSAAVATQELNSDSKVEEEDVSKTRLVAQNVPWSCTVEDIRSLFEKHGTVLEVELSMYNKTRNRGLAFVEMGSPEEALAALTNLESSEYEGRTLRLNYAKPRKEKPSLPQPRPVPTFNLFVANLSYEARAKDLREFFDSGNGNVVSAEVIFHENPRRSSGYGFIAFKSKKAAEAAISTFQAKEFMGRPIRIARSKQFVKLQKKESLQSSEASGEEESVAEEATSLQASEASGEEESVAEEATAAE